MVLVGLDILGAKTMNVVAMQRFRIPYKLPDIKYYQSWIHAKSNKAWSEHVLNRQVSYPIFQLKEIHKT